jgi:hypothetical protein
MRWMWGVMGVAMISAVAYLRKFWRRIGDGIKRRRRVELLFLNREEKRERLRAGRREARALEVEGQGY